MDFEHGFKTSVTLLLVVEMIAGVFCSSSVLFTSWRKKQVKNVSTLLLVNLAGIDFILCCTGIPLTIIRLTWYPRNTLLFCCFHEAVTSSLRNASLVKLLLISYYRYWSVTHPFRIRMSLGSARKMLYISWLVTFLFACIPFIELQLRETVSLDASCTTWFGNPSHALYFRMYYLPVFVLGCAVQLPLYYKISRTALFRLQLQSIANASTLIAPVVIPIQAAKEGNSSTRQKKRRIVKLTGAIICSVCGLWLPYTICTFVLYFVKPSLALSRLEFVFLVLGYFNCTLNPVLYAFTKHKFRNAFLSLLPCCKRYVEQDTAPL